MAVMVSETNNKSHGILLNFETILDIEDLKETDDNLGFSKKIDGFITYVNEYLGNRKSIVVGIYGSYGTGKSAFIQMVGQRVKDETPFIVFHAWKYKDEKSIWRNFILKTVDDLYKNNCWTYSYWKGVFKRGKLRNDIYYTQTRKSIDVPEIIFFSVIFVVLNYISVFQYIFPNNLGFSYLLLSAITSLIITNFSLFFYERSKQPLSSIEEFEEKFIKSIDGCGHKKIYIVIENIDRCLPHHSIRLLESLSSFLEPLETKGKTQCIFLVPCDKRMIEKAITMECGNIEDLDSSAYLDKLIQLPYDLPIPSSENYQEYVKSLLNEKYKSEKIDFGNEAKAYHKWLIELLATSGITNPREIKLLFREWEMRFVNIPDELKYDGMNGNDKRINLKTALILLKLLVLKKNYLVVYSVCLDITSIADKFLDPQKLNELLECMFEDAEEGKKLWEFLKDNKANSLYDGRIDKIYRDLNIINETKDPEGDEKLLKLRTMFGPGFKLMKWAHIKPASFSDLQKIMFATKSGKEDIEIGMLPGALYD